jgi:threonine synthase
MISLEYHHSTREGITRKTIEDKNIYTMWRYVDFLPIDMSDVISLNEGFTPLIKLKNIGSNLGIKIYVKNESINPTGSFKDRGSSVLIAWLKKNGVKRIAVTSSGNFASSMAAYSARAGIECYLFVPSTSAIGKILPSMLYGAKVIKTPILSELTKVLDTCCDRLGLHLCSGSPISWEGSKTIGYEVCEQLKWNPPDWLTFPSGTCTGFTGIWKGFKELKKIELIPYMPRMICITRGTPIVEAFKSKSNKVTYKLREETIAGPISRGCPDNRGNLALKALYETDGLAEGVTDEEIIVAAKDLARKEGIFVEPSSAASVAGVLKLADEGQIDRGDVVVCVLTGSGYKALDKYEPFYEEPYIVEASVEALVNLFSKIGS